MNERQQDVLRLQPQMIPAVRATIRSAIDQLNDAILGLGRRGFLPQPWLGDETSDAVAAHYTNRAMSGPDSSFNALTLYRAELTRVHDTLQQMEDHYRRTEGDNAALWGLKA
jgi:hypothetical protein